MASTSAQTDKSDPVVLGVSIPLSVTVAAAKQVGAAWQKFGVDLVQALTHVRDAKSPPLSKQEKSEALESTASASAGVNA